MSQPQPGATPVMPEGNDVGVWAGARAFAETLDLREVAAEAARHADGLPRMIVISAHPDDETIGAGHLLAQWTRHHGTAIALTMTGGEGALRGTGQDVRFLAERRLGEWRSATSLLGAERHITWHIPHWECEQHEEAAVTKLASKLEPGDVLVAPWQFEPEPDHRAAGRIAAAAAAQCDAATLLEYLIWTPYLCPPEILGEHGYDLVRVITGDTAAGRRKEALRHYTSQTAPLKTNLQPVVPHTLIEHHAEQWVVRPSRSEKS